MADIPRKKSPRAPSIPLEDAIGRVMKVYDRERLHPAPTDVIAQHLGYKSANNGSALSTLASLRYYGLLERPREGMLAVSKDVESFKFAPEDKLKHVLLLGFLKRPALYSELLEKYETGLPSDANLKFELIQRGFAPQAAEQALSVFKESVLFANYYSDASSNGNPEPEVNDPNSDHIQEYDSLPTNDRTQSHNAQVLVRQDLDDADLDRIPVRLTGGRRAWLVIPTPFYDADKARLKAQIDLLLTIEDEEPLS